jgi:DNA-binding response OmpR family regulator
MTRPAILIVEDDAMTSALLRVLFEKQGFEVTLIQDGQTALDHLNEKPAYRAVLLDILLPHVNGLHLLKHARSLPQWADAKIMVLSAKDQEPDIRLAQSLGANGYLTKPFDPNELLALIG